jgi:low temperature requirement protein LtrA
MLTVACMWWVYFNHASNTTVRESPRARFLWFFAHLPLAIGITTMGVAITITAGGHMEHLGGSHWMLLGSSAVSWAMLGLIEFVTRPIQPDPRTVLILGRAAGVLVLIVAGMLGYQAPPALLMGLVALTGVVQVILDISWGAKIAQKMREGRFE